MKLVLGAAIAAQKVIDSGLKFKNIDLEWAMVYVALNMDQDQIYKEKLADIIPYRKSNKGNRPTVLTIADDVKRQRW